MELTIEYPLSTNINAKPRLAGPPETKEMMALNVDVYTDETAFQSLASEWNELVIKADAPLCMTLEWVENWWHHFGENPNRQLYIITMRNKKKLVGLAPFYVGYSGIAGQVIHRRLQIIGSGGSKNEQWGFTNDYGISDFLDIITDPEFREPLGVLLMDILSVLTENVDEITFHQVREDSFIKQVLFPKMESKSWQVTLNHSDTCPYVDLAGISNLDDFIKGVKSNARRRLRQTMRAMDKEPEFLVTEVLTPDGLTRATQRLIELHQARWNELGFPGVFHDERFEQFFKDLIKKSAEKKWLWFKEAQDVAGVSASRMLIRFNGRFYDYISGFDPESPSAKYRPGFGLLLEVVQDAIAQNINRIELLRGEESYKYDFTDLNFKNWEISITSEAHKSLVKRLSNKLLRVVSAIYTTVGKEKNLLKVQYQNRGWMGALPGYISFRTESIRRRLKGD